MKTVIKIFIPLFLLISVLTPKVSYAAQKTENFCSALSAKSENLNLKIQTKQAEILTENDKKQLLLKNSREIRQADLDNLRALANQRLGTRLDGIEKTAKTKTQKQAVNNFKTLVDLAIQTRKTTIDSIVNSFQKGLDGTISSYQIEIQNALEDFKKALNAAETKAKTSCANKSNPETVKTNFNLQIKIATEAFNLRRKNLNSLDAKLQKLKDTRNAEVAKADEKFKTEVNQAAQKLKTELGKK